MSEEVLAIDAGTILTPFERFSPGRILVRRGSIENVGGLSDIHMPANTVRIDATNLTVTPGFIDPHVHGAGGMDVMEGSRKAIDVISRSLARHGTTSFLATTVSSPPSELGATVDRLSLVLRESFEGAQPLGIHLEGPFLSVSKRGTHRAAWIQPADENLLSEWVGRSQGMLKLLTMAPEIEGAASLLALARAAGVTVGMGHSDASLGEASAAADSGVHYAVHTFNAMRPFSHRDPGIVGAVLSDDRIFAEIIADGVHVNPEVVRIFARAKGRNRVILVTDATSATGMPDGRYSLGGDLVEVSGGICRDSEGRLAGSTLTQDVALRNFIQWSGMRLDDAVLGLTSNVAEALGLNGRGRIEPGARADLVMLDNDHRVVKTFVEGKLVHDG